MSLFSVLKLLVPPGLRPTGLASRLLRRLRSDGRIGAGIFAGMRYTRGSICSANSPKLLGVYEIELKPIFDSLWPLSFPRIVIVGAAEGYYAVGCALKWLSASVIAFESSAEGRELLGQVVELNGVKERIDIRGHCSVESLRDAVAVSGTGLLLMDVEGGETDLLDSTLLGALSAYHLIVEIHDFVDPGIADCLRKRFQPSHRVQEIWTRPRKLSDFQMPSFLPLRWYMLRGLRASSKEYRPGQMRWFYLAPRQSEPAQCSRQPARLEQSLKV